MRENPAAAVTHDVSGKVCLVTGANTGIGRITARELARKGGHVFCAGRSRERTQPVVDEIIAETGNQKVEFLPLDLDSLASVREAADAFLKRGLPLHILVNNAGLGSAQGTTQDGFERLFGVNHLGHFLFTELLLDKLKESAPARIVNVSSDSHYQAKGIDFDKLKQPTASVTGMPEYAVSKLSNVLFTRELARRLEGTGVTTYALHPGVVATDVWRRVPWPVRPMIKLFMLSEEEGAKTTLDCATAPERAEETGLYYAKCRSKKPSRQGLDDALAKELWDRSTAWTRA